MRKTLYLKFVLGYLIFGFFGFLVVATFVSSMTLEHLKREKADSLYKEATLIANTYASDLYSSNVSLEEVKKQLDALSTYLSSQIWIINPSGRIIMTTETPLDVEHESRVENFDSTITAGSFYTVGDFFGCFQQEMLSVFAPITSNFKVQGYVVIHIPMADIRASSESLLNYFLYYARDFFPSVADHSDFLYRNGLSAAAQDHGSHRAVRGRQSAL